MNGLEEQYRKPEGDDGRKILKHMNKSHRNVTEWGLNNIPDSDPKVILDAGCGGGMCINLLSHIYPDTQITGLDFSSESLKSTEMYNENLVTSGRLHTVCSEVSNVPFADGTFDLITAVETYFFWPNQEHDVAELVRVLAPDGILCIVSEMYITSENRKHIESMNERYNMNIVENHIVSEYMSEAGLDVTVSTDKTMNWITFIGQR